MKYSRLISFKNLEIAWRRISTGRNLQYKKIFRPIYLAYEIAHTDNLKHLSQRLKGGWEPTSPKRIYVPKPSGLQRPLTLLPIEDQIVLQAVANAFAMKLYERRKLIENKVVFSNLLNPPDNSIFFLKDWHKTYFDFQARCEKYFVEGYRWIAHFDLAAFYDTISHELLIKLVSPRGGNQKTWEKVRSWFRCWSAAGNALPIQHGIPQGPIASDFIAECLLIPLDEALLKDGFRYVRYVDDIRIFTKSRIEAQRAAIRLEILCRTLGLIPQGKKFAISEAKTLDQALGSLPSLAPPDQPEGDGGPSMDAETAVKKFYQSLEGRPYQIRDKSIARYVLYRAPKSQKLLALVLRLLPRHPEHIDSFSHYLSNFKKGVGIERAIIDIFNMEIPYGYVRGELWYILARIGSVESLKQMMPIAKAELIDENACDYLNWGAFNFLLSCERNNLLKISKRIKSQSPLVQSLIIPQLPEKEFKKNGAVSALLTSKAFEPGIMLAEQLVKRNLTHRDYGLKVRQLSPQVQNVFRELGIIKRRSKTNVDQIAEILVKRYEIPSILKWKNIFKGEYVHALQILIQADAVYFASRSHWLQLHNSFNDALLRAFIAFLISNNLPGVIKLKDKNGKLIKFGVLLDRQKPLSKSYPKIADPFRKANQRRNKLPGSHPYDEKGGAKNTYLKLNEQMKLKGLFSVAYEEIILLVDKFS
jgi:hypothetical protein